MIHSCSYNNLFLLLDDVVFVQQYLVAHFTDFFAKSFKLGRFDNWALTIVYLGCVFFPSFKEYKISI